VCGSIVRAPPGRLAETASDTGADSLMRYVSLRTLDPAEFVVESGNQFQARASLPQRTVQELIDEGLPVLEPFVSASVRIRESHEQARPMIHLDPRHKLSAEFVALHEALERRERIDERKRRRAAGGASRSR